MRKDEDSDLAGSQQHDVRGGKVKNKQIRLSLCSVLLEREREGKNSFNSL